MLQPILVRPVKGEADAFEIVAGERRWRAAQMAKLHDVPVVVREMTDGESLELAIIENVQRADLNAVEEAAAYRELMERFAYTQDDVAQRGRQEPQPRRQHASAAEAAGDRPEHDPRRTADGRPCPNTDRRERSRSAGARNCRVALNVREAEQRSKPTSGKGREKAEKDADTKALESSLSNMLGLKVQILDKGEKGGELRIIYRTLEQLDDVCRRLNKRRLTP